MATTTFPTGVVGQQHNISDRASRAPGLILFKLLIHMPCMLSQVSIYSSDHGVSPWRSIARATRANSRMLCYMLMGLAITLNLFGADPMPSFVWLWAPTLTVKNNRKGIEETMHQRTMGVMPQVAVFQKNSRTGIVVCDRKVPMTPRNYAMMKHSNAVHSVLATTYCTVHRRGGRLTQRGTLWPWSITYDAVPFSWQVPWCSHISCILANGCWDLC